MQILCRRILIDAGDKGIQDYVTTLAKVLKDHGVDIESIVITHWHTGHAGGVNDVCTGVFKRTPENPIGYISFIIIFLNNFLLIFYP